jgi:hypothetical protein
MTSSDTRQQWMSSSHFTQHSVFPVIFKHTAGINQPSSITKLPRGSTGSKRTRTAYTSARLREMEQEFRNSNYFCRPRRVSLATMRNLSRRKMKIWFRNKTKKKKKKKGEIQRETKTIGFSNSMTISMSPKTISYHLFHLNAWIVSIPQT